MEELRNEQKTEQQGLALNNPSAVAVPTGNVWQDKVAFEQTARVAALFEKIKEESL